MQTSVFPKQQQDVTQSWNDIFLARALTTFMMSNDKLTRNNVVKNYVVERDVTKSC